MSSLAFPDEMISQISSTIALSNFETELHIHLAKAALFQDVINANDSRSEFIGNHKPIQEQEAEIQEQQKIVEVIKAEVDEMNKDRLSSQRMLYELKDKVIDKSPSNGTHYILFGLDEKVISPVLLESAEVSNLEATLESASNLSAFLLQRVELHRKLPALALKRKEETKQQASLKDMTNAIKMYEKDLQLLDQACAEAEADWNTGFNPGSGQNQRKTVGQQECQPQEACWEDQPAPQYDDQFVQNLFEVAGSQQETIAELKQKIEEQRLEILNLTSSSADTTKALEDGNKILEPFFKCAEDIRVRKYELELRHRDETKVQLGNLAAHQGCAIVDAYQFVQGVLDSKKHLPTFNKWYGDVAPGTVWEGRGCEKFIKMLNWRCGMYDFISSTAPSYEESAFARYFNVVMEDNKDKTGDEFEHYLTQHITGIKAMELMEIEFGFALLTHKNPNYLKKR